MRLTRLQKFLLPIVVLGSVSAAPSSPLAENTFQEIYALYKVEFSKPDRERPIVSLSLVATDKDFGLTEDLVFNVDRSPSLRYKIYFHSIETSWCFWSEKEKFKVDGDDAYAMNFRAATPRNYLTHPQVVGLVGVPWQMIRIPESVEKRLTIETFPEFAAELSAGNRHEILWKTAAEGKLTPFASAILYESSERLTGSDAEGWQYELMIPREGFEMTGRERFLLSYDMSGKSVHTQSQSFGESTSPVGEDRVVYDPECHYSELHKARFFTTTSYDLKNDQMVERSSTTYTLLGTIPYSDSIHPAAVGPVIGENPTGDNSLIKRYFPEALAIYLSEQGGEQALIKSEQMVPPVPLN